MNIKRTIFLLSILVFPLSVVLADFSQADWATSRPLALPSLSAPEYIRVPLDSKVAGNSNGYRDLRVIKEPSEVEVPYQLVVEDASVTSEYVPARTLDTVSDGFGRLMFILDLGKTGVLHSRLNIETFSENYRRQVSVYASSALLPHGDSGWNMLTDTGYIFKFSDRTAGFATAKGEVAYPESSAQYLRVVVEGGMEGALSLTSANVYRYNVSVGKKVTQDVGAEVNEYTADQTTEVIADLGVSGIPTKSIQLSVQSAGNFSRSVTVFGGNNGKTWSQIGRGYLSQIETAKFTGSSFALSYPESTYRYYRAVIQNFDDASLSIEPRARFEGVLRTVVFEATPGNAYALYYGNAKAYAPKYDLSRYFDYLDTTELKEGALGTVHENTKYVAPEAPVVPFTDRNKLLLNITLALLCVLIAGVVFWYIWSHKRMEVASRSASSTSPHVKEVSPTPTPVVPPTDTEQPPRV